MMTPSAPIKSSEVPVMSRARITPVTANGIVDDRSVDNPYVRAIAINTVIVGSVVGDEAAFGLAIVNAQTTVGVLFHRAVGNRTGGREVDAVFVAFDDAVRYVGIAFTVKSVVGVVGKYAVVEVAAGGIHTTAVISVEGTA